jgi:5'-nucleotidase
MRFMYRTALAATAALCASPAFALNILVCNDDGITAANVRALKHRLAAAGHQVIITAPIDNQSGTGGFVRFLQPIPPLLGTERGARALSLPAGSPGVGTDPTEPGVYYVNGTPVMACLYGIDVKAPRVFGRAPDLVITGPNEGNNTGHINNSSGTFNTMLYAVNRGLPAVAISDAVTTQVTWSTSLAPTARPFEVADIVVKLLGQLTRQSLGGRGALLPEGLGLNVNIPEFAPGSGVSLPLKITQIGFATAFAPAFFEKLSDSPLAVSFGANVALPGISLAAGGTVLPSGTVMPTDRSSRSEANVIESRAAITVSPVQGVPEASGLFLSRMRATLHAHD